MIYFATFPAIVIALLMAVYATKLFRAKSTLQALAMIGLVSFLGTVEMWLIQLIVRYLTS
jgi:hypothetical protein